MRHQSTFMAATVGLMLLVTSIFGIPNAAKADLIGILGGDTIDETLNNFSAKFDEISERRIRELLLSFEKTAKETIAEGIAGGQLVAVQAGHSLNVATQSAAAILGDQINSSVSEVDRSLQEMMVLLVQFEHKVSVAKDEIIDFADLLSLDLEIIAGRVYGIEDAPLHLRGFSNTVFAVEEDSADKRVVVRGPFFGSDPDGVSSDISFSIGGTSIGSGRAVSGLNSKHDREIWIPSELVLNEVSDSLIETLELRMDVKREVVERCGLAKKLWNLLGFYECQKSESFEGTIPLTILPRLIGTVTVEQRRPTYDYVPIDERFETTVRVGASTTIPLSLPVVPNSGPTLGQKIFDRTDVRTTCASDIKRYRKFTQDQTGAIEIAGNDSWFVSGFTAVNVGPGRHSGGNDVDGPGTVEDVLSDVAQRMKGKIGLEPFRGKAPLRKLISDRLWALINSGWHIQDPWYNYDMELTAAELKSVSESYERDVSGCGQQANGEPTSVNSTSLQVPITSSTTETSFWTASAAQLVWSVVGREDEKETLDVRVGELLEFEISKPRETDVLLRFQSSILGLNEQFTPDLPPKGFVFLGPSRLGDSEVRRFRFNL